MIGTNDGLKEVSPAQKQDQVVIESLRQFMDVDKFKQSKNGAALLELLLNQNSKKSTRSILIKLKTMFMCQVPVARLCSLQFIRESMEAGNKHVVELVAELFLQEFSKIVNYRSHVKSILRGSTYFMPKIGRHDSQDDTNKIIKISNTFFRMASECIYIWGKMYFLDSPFSEALKQLESTCKFPLFPGQFKFFNQTKITAFLARGLTFNFGDRKQQSTQIRKLNDVSNGKASTVPVERMAKTEESNSKVENEKNEQGILGQHQSEKQQQRNVLAQTNRSRIMQKTQKFKRKERISQVRSSSVSSYSFETPELVETQKIREARVFSFCKKSRIEIPLGVIAQQQNQSPTAPTSLNQPKPQTDLVQHAQPQQLTQQPGILPTQASIFANVQINATQDSSPQNIDKVKEDQTKVQPAAQVATKKPISIMGSSESQLAEEECLIPELSDREVSPKNGREQYNGMEMDELRKKTRTIRRKKEQKGRQKISKNSKLMKKKMEPEDDKGKLIQATKKEIKGKLPIESTLQIEQKINLPAEVKEESCSTKLGKVLVKDIIEQGLGRILDQSVLSGGVPTKAPRVQLKSGLQMSIAFQPSVNQEVSRQIEAKIHEQFASFKSQIIAHQEELFLKTTRASKLTFEDPCNSCATQTHFFQRRRASQISVKAKPQIMQEQSSLGPRRLSAEYGSVERRRQGGQPPANTLLYLLYRRKSMGVI